MVSSPNKLFYAKIVLLTKTTQVNMIRPEWIIAAREFFNYGATRGNHADDGSVPGPLTPYRDAMGEFVSWLMTSKPTDSCSRPAPTGVSNPTPEDVAAGERVRLRSSLISLRRHYRKRRDNS